MKKVITGIAICACFGTEGMLVPYGSDASVVASARRETTNTVVESEAGTSEVCNYGNDEATLLQRVNFRKISQLRIRDNRLQVKIMDCIRTGENVELIGDWYTRSYPLEKTLLRYEHDFVRAFSTPVQELFAFINDVEFADKSGKVVFNREYVDEDTVIPHVRRAVNRYAMDDEHLQAKPFTEIVIYTESGEQVIDDAKVREDDAFVAYTRTDTPAEENMIGEPEARADDAEFSYQRKETLEEYRRPDGTIFTKKTEGVKKVAKPTPPPPVAAPVQYIWVPVKHEKHKRFGGHYWVNVGQEQVPANSGIWRVGYDVHGQRWVNI